MRVGRAVFALVAALAAPTALVGCRSGSALHGRYNDFRAYYNTYYNAERSLEEGETALQRPDAPIDRGQLVAVFPLATASGGQAGPFQEAIDKSAELLRNRPDSKWADDALLVIGKAYFYQRNVVGAEQKFRETLAAAEATGDRRLGSEAQFWLGRTHAAAERYDDGVAVLEEGLAEEDVDRRWAARMRLALGELYARAGRWGEAAEALAAGAPDAGDADLAARAYVLLGQVEEESGRFDAAAEAYAAALDQRPVYELAFAAETGRALVLGLDAGRPDEALDNVSRMRGDDKHYARRGELALVQARLLAAAGRDGDALALFRDVLYDPDLDARTVRGEAHYRLGEFYRDVRDDYVRAAAHFDTAATALPDAQAVAQVSRAALVGVDDEARTYGTLAASARRVAEVDSLLALGDLSDDEFRARIEAIEAARARVYVEEQRRLEAERQAQAFSGGGGVPIDRQRQDGQAGGPGAAPVNADEAGFLAYRDPAALVAGQIAFEQRWGSRPLVPDWRRRAAIQAGPVASEVGGIGRANPLPGFAPGEGPPRLDLSKVPRTPAKREELVTELAGLRYELANAFFLSLGRADTASVLYRTILDETPDLPVAVRARYALAEIELAGGRDDAARPLYEAVVAADTTGVLAEASRFRLGLADPDDAAEAVETSAAYDAARARWRAGQPREAAADLVAFADADPDGPLAPRAYLAAAAAYVEWARGDSLALAAPLPPDLVSAVLQPVADADGAPDDAAPDLDDDAAPEDRPGVGAPPPPEPDLSLLGGAPQPDSIATALPDSAAVVLPDSAAALPELPVLTLRDYLRALASLYPATPYADRARVLADRLPEPPPSDPADSLAAPLAPFPDDTDAPPAAASEQFPGTEERRDGPPDDEAAPDLPPGAEAPAGDAPPDGEAAVFGDAPVDPAAGGLSWRVQSFDVLAEGTRTVQVLRAEGYAVTVAYDEAARSYLLLVGQFETEEEGEATRPSLPAWVQARATLVPVDDLTVIEDGAEPRD